MSRTKLVDQCLQCALKWRPDGPWILVISDSNLAIVEEKTFWPGDTAEARTWLLEHTKDPGKIPGFKPWSCMSRQKVGHDG